jgi:hypothetical protein
MRNVSTERLFRAMHGTSLDPMCLCAAHLLVPLNVVRLPDNERSVLSDPIIVATSSEKTVQCFRDPMFPNHPHMENEEHEQGDMHDSHHQRSGGTTTDKKTPTTTGAISSNNNANTEDERKIRSSLFSTSDGGAKNQKDGENEGHNSKGSKIRLEEMERQRDVIQTLKALDESGTMHCEQFPGRLLVEYMTDDGLSVKRTWKDSSDAMCIVHCASVMARKAVYEPEGGLFVNYAHAIYQHLHQSGVQRRTGCTWTRS